MSNDCGLPGNFGGRSCPNDYLKDLSYMLITKRGENTFPTLSAMTSEAIQTAINNGDPTLRLLPVAEIENFDPTVGDPKVQEFTSGRKQYIKAGVTTFSFLIVGGDGLTEDEFVQLNNGTYDAYLYDSEGGLMYRKPTDSTEDQVQAMPISIGSWTPKTEFSNGSDRAENLMVSVDLDQNKYKSKERRYANSGVLSYSVEDIAVPLVDVNVDYSATTTTTTVATIYDNRDNPIRNLAIANIDSIVVGGVSKTVSSITESSTAAGEYTIEWSTAGTSGDEVAISYTGDGYDWYYANLTTTEAP